MRASLASVLLDLQPEGSEGLRVRYNAASRSEWPDFDHPEKLQVSIGDVVTLFGEPELVISVLWHLLEQCEEVLKEADRTKKVA